MPMPSAERRLALAGPLGVDRLLRGVHRAAGGERPVGVVVARLGRTEHRHHRIAHVLHHRSARVEDRTVHLGAVAVELLGEHRRVGVLGDGRVAADVAHQHRDVEPLGLAEPRPPASGCVGDAGGQQPGQRLALLLALDDRRVQPAQAVESAGLAGRDSLGEAAEQPLDARLDGRRRRCSARRSP